MRHIEMHQRTQGALAGQWQGTALNCPITTGCVKASTGAPAASRHGWAEERR